MENRGNLLSDCLVHLAIPVPCHFKQRSRKRSTFDFQVEGHHTGYTGVVPDAVTSGNRFVAARLEAHSLMMLLKTGHNRLGAILPVTVAEDDIGRWGATVKAVQVDE